MTQKPQKGYKLTDNWRRFILFVYRSCPNGIVSIKVVEGQPYKLIDAKRDIRFDKDGDIPLSYVPEGSSEE